MKSIYRYSASLILMLGLNAGVFAGDYAEGFIAAESYDYPTAVKILGPLADQGNADAQFNIALMYHSGAGVTANEPEAVKWYTKAAKNGHRTAKEYLAAAYAEGWFGLAQDEKMARFWYSKLDD